MLEIILLIIGIIKLTRRPKLKRLSSSDFPNVETAKFNEWKKAELTATDIFLWATWGAFIIKIIILISIQESYYGESALAIAGGILLFWFIGLIIAAIYGSKAKALRIRLGINKDLTPSVGSESDAIPNKIEKLSTLKEKGLISEEEFNTKKKELLDRM